MGRDELKVRRRDAMRPGITAYRVCLSSKKGTVPKHSDGLRYAFYNIQSTSIENAIKCAKKHCIVLSGRIDGSAWIASPADLGCC